MCDELDQIAGPIANELSRMQLAYAQAIGSPSVTVSLKRGERWSVACYPRREAQSELKRWGNAETLEKAIGECWKQINKITPSPSRLMGIGEIVEQTGRE